MRAVLIFNPTSGISTVTDKRMFPKRLKEQSYRVCKPMVLRQKFTILNRLEAIFILITSSSNILNWIVKRLIKRPRPTEELVTVARVINEPSFPGGHVMHYIN